MSIASLFKRKRLMRAATLSLLFIGVSVALLVAACAGAQGPAGPAGAASSPEDINKAINEKMAKYDKNVPLWAIQAGTAVRMRELTESFNLMWYAAQAGNWDLAGFEVYRADGQVKAVAVTRPARVPMLNAWAEPNLKALNDAVKAKGIAAFEKAYDSAIAGCNACHAASEGGGFPMKSIKVTRPTQPTYSNIDYKGQ